jgi:hypothetical protein
MGKVMVKTSGPKNYQAISNAFGGHRRIGLKLLDNFKVAGV